MSPLKVVVAVHRGMAVLVEKPPGVAVVLMDYDGVGEDPDTLEHPVEEEIREEGA